MPWKVSGVVEKRKQFVKEWLTENWTMTELCARHGISRQAGYNTLTRYEQAGWESLAEQSRAPRQHPNQTPAEIEQQIVDLRHEHMRWGPRKLKAVLERESPEVNWPAASTMGELLRREGLVIPRKKRRRVDPYTAPFAAADAPNRVWCGDFKGWSRTQDGARIDPLTISDACSRFLLRCQAVEKTDTARVQAIFEAAFREYGLPEAIRTDNGAPFSSCANQHRPHEALALQTPASCYTPSPRSYPARVPEPEYSSALIVRRISPGGQFAWKKHEVFLSETLRGEPIALQPIDDRWYTIYFAEFALGQFDSRTCTVHRLPPGLASTEREQGKGNWSAP